MNLMEILLTVAIFLIIGSLLVVATNTLLQGSTFSFQIANTAVTLNQIDRHIRETVNDMHIPYWANPMPYIENLSAGLYRSKIGPYISSSRIIFDRNRSPRGIEVIYTVNNREMRTVALFSSVIIMETAQ